MSRKNLPIAFYLFLLFISGSVVGALGYRAYNPPTARTINAPPSPGEWRRNYIEESRVRLNLSDDQVDKLKAILDQTEARFRDVRDRENQAIRDIREEHFARVQTILSGDQISKYQKLHAEREAKAKENEQHKR